MALLAPTVLTGGNSPTLITVPAAAGGDTVAYNPARKQVLIVTNGGGSSITVTLTAQRTTLRIGEDVFSRANVVAATAAGATRYFSITEAFADANGLINVTYSAVTSVTVGVLELDF